MRTLLERVREAQAERLAIHVEEDLSEIVIEDIDQAVETMERAS
jgi:hypothetical protein